VKVYSPTQLSNHQFCGIFRKLQKAGWYPKYMDNRDIAMFVGSAVSAGLELLYNGTLPSLSETEKKKAVEEKAWAEYQQRYTDHTKLGRVLGDRAEPQHRLAMTTIRGYLSHHFTANLFEDWTIIGCELTMSNQCRLDLIGYDPRGCLSIVDFKCRSSLEKPKAVNWIDKQMMGNQAFTYRYMYEHDFQHRAEKFYIGLMVQDPKYWLLRGHMYNEQRYDLWLQSAEVSWRRMEVEDDTHTLGEENPNHANEFGQCQYTDACLHMGRDETEMRRTYVQMEEPT
jgi:hypothetical protein